jgi:hypothetical protein
MRKLSLAILAFFFGLMVLTVSESLNARQQPPNPDENMKAEDFTKILKDEWTYLKEATDEYLASVSKKTEFETSKEYADRTARLKSAYVVRINAHIKEKKLDKRAFGVLFKAALPSTPGYNADLQQYVIASSGSVEAPYDIPTLHCIVPKNPYVFLMDSVNRGFRTSALRIHFPSTYRWKVARDDARMAKAEESNIYFRVRFVVDMSQEDMVKQAKLKMIPQLITMINVANQKIYWSEDLK